MADPVYYNAAIRSNQNSSNQNRNAHVVMPDAETILHKPIVMTQSGKHKLLKVGVIMISAGLVAMVSQVVTLVYSKSHCFDFFILISDYVPEESAGIWCGFLIIVNGTLCIVASRKNMYGWVVMNLVLSVLTNLLIWVLIILTAQHLGDVRSSFNCDKKSIFYVFDAFLIIVALLQFVLSLFTCILSCGALCSCCYNFEDDGPARNPSATRRTYQPQHNSGYEESAYVNTALGRNHPYPTQARPTSSLGAPPSAPPAYLEKDSILPAPQY